MSEVPVVKRGKGRPSLGDSLIDTFVLAVSIDGRVVTWSDGQWSGDKSLIVEAKWKSDARVLVPLTYEGVLVEADDHNLLGALAAMIAVNPGRARILSVPENIDLLLGEFI